MLTTENDQLRVTNLVIKKGLSVRETEALASKRSRPAARGEAPRDRSIADIEAHLQRVLGTRVRIFHGKKRGRIQIEYYSTEDLNRLLDLLAAKK